MNKLDMIAEAHERLLRYSQIILLRQTQDEYPDFWTVEDFWDDLLSQLSYEYGTDRST